MALRMNIYARGITRSFKARRPANCGLRPGWTGRTCSTLISGKPNRKSTAMRNPVDRALIEQLIAATRLYASSTAIKELLEFTVRLRAFAPFNAMLLHIQKPGLTHAATAADWWQRFGRVPKEGARPLIVLRVMGPVDFVFDVLDTEGRDLPDQAFTFPTLGNISQERFDTITACVTRSGIELKRLDAGDAQAGWIRRLPARRSRRQSSAMNLP